MQDFSRHASNGRGSRYKCDGCENDSPDGATDFQKVEGDVVRRTHELALHDGYFVAGRGTRGWQRYGDAAEFLQLIHLPLVLPSRVQVVAVERISELTPRGVTLAEAACPQHHVRRTRRRCDLMCARMMHRLEWRGDLTPNLMGVSVRCCTGAGDEVDEGVALGVWR